MKSGHEPLCSQFNGSKKPGRYLFTVCAYRDIEILVLICNVNNISSPIIIASTTQTVFGNDTHCVTRYHFALQTQKIVPKILASWKDVWISVTMPVGTTAACTGHCISWNRARICPGTIPVPFPRWRTRTNALRACWSTVSRKTSVLLL